MCGGAAFVPAGYSPGTGLSCARGCAAGRCSAIGLFCVRFVPGVRSSRNVLRSITPAVCRIAPNRTACGSVARFAFVHAGVCGSGGAVCRHSRRGLRFYCGVLPLVHAGRAVLLRCFAFGSRRACGSIAVFCLRFTPVFFPLSGKKRRLAISCVSIPPGRDRHSCVLAALFGYLPWRVHFGLVRLFVAISTENERNEGTRRTESAARRLYAFARAHWP